MTKQDFSRLFLAGAVATLVMAGILYTAPFIGMPKMDMAAMLGWIFQGFTAEPRTGAWWAGMAFYLVNGSVVLPLIFSAFFASHLPGPAWLKGTIWGLILWEMLELVVMPLMDVGVFSRRALQPGMLDAVNFAGHVVYGVLFGALAGNIAMHIGLPSHRERHV